MLHILVSTNSEKSDDVKLADLALGRLFLHSNGDSEVLIFSRHLKQSCFDIFMGRL